MTEGSVTIEFLRPDKKHWSIRVADTGAGIPVEAQEYIFEPFRQVDNSVTHYNRGTGLGLSITKQLVELNTVLQSDFEVELFKDGNLAQEALARLTPDLIVLNMHLPGVSGKQILKNIWAEKRFSDAEVILTTADSLLAYSLYDQADLVVLKPLSPMQLREFALKLLPKKTK